MANFAPQAIGYTGANITLSAPAGIDSVSQPSTRTFLWVKNGSGGSVTFGMTIPGTTFEQANPDISFSIPAGEERMVGPLDPVIAGSNGLIGFLVSPTTSVTVAAVVLPTPPPDFP